MTDYISDGAFWSFLALAGAVGAVYLLAKVQAEQRLRDFKRSERQLDEWGARFAGRIDATRPEPMARLYCLIGSHGPYEVPVVQLQDAECPRCAEVSQAMLDDAVAVAKAHLMPHQRLGGESR